ncbi:S41 family peptidase, partial [Candidatus Gracilibacteria bacterium]|nr:S41 family peptidase [Candidatus Gracilibacteria bacterium]
ITSLKLDYVFIKLTSHLEAKDILNYSKIDLNITGANAGTPFYRSLQKMVKVGALPNSSYYLNRNKEISAYTFYKLAEKIYNINLIQASQINSLKKRSVTQSDINSLNKIFDVKVKSYNEELPKVNLSNSKLLEQKKEIFEDVQKTLLKSHYDRDVLDEIKLIEAATIGLTKGTDDQFTTFFPPTENKTFMETLDGKFEGIGSYVEMLEPGVLKIVTPIAGSPSEKAGLKGGDQITHADGKKITINTSIGEAISWVKGPKGTSVELTVLRGTKILKISVIRDTIIIKNVEHESINSSTYYIKLVSFGEGISSEFNEALTAMKKQKSTKKVIIDLRNNPGGYLYEVSDILSHFVPKKEETVVVKYLNGDKNYYSKGYTKVNFSKYRIIILQNSGSASASEIMAGTIKDYLPNTTIIGEQSYGKGSVQTIKKYQDGSSLKYTIAKWFTGKTVTGIDGVGIPVDIELEFDFEEYKKTKKDNQLDKAKSIK